MAENTTLSGKRLRFVEEYCVDQNATQAAVRAGYSAHTARQQGTRLLSNASIRAAIEARLTKVSTDLGVTSERVIAEFARIAFGGMSTFLQITPDGDPMVDLSKCSPEDLDQLAEVTVEDFRDGRGEDARDVRRIKIKPQDKQKALENLAKILGVFKDKGAEATDRQTDLLASFIAEMGKRGSRIPVKPSDPEVGG